MTKNSVSNQPTPEFPSFFVLVLPISLLPEYVPLLSLCFPVQAVFTYESPPWVQTLFVSMHHC